MADLSTVFTSVISGGTSITGTVLIVLGVLALVLAVFGGFFAWFWMNRRYNLDLEIKKIRSDGQIILGEWGKGLFNAKRGVLMVKRKKMKAIPIKIIDIRKYLQGDTLVTLIQVGPRDFRPVVADSWTEHVVEYQDEKTKEIVKVKECILNIKVDSADNQAWESAYNSASKKAYSITSFFSQFQVPITVAIVVVAIFIGFAIIWTRLPSICG